MGYKQLDTKDKMIRVKILRCLKLARNEFKATNTKYREGKLEIRSNIGTTKFRLYLTSHFFAVKSHRRMERSALVQEAQNDAFIRNTMVDAGLDPSEILSHVIIHFIPL